MRQVKLDAPAIAAASVMGSVGALVLALYSGIMQTSGAPTSASYRLFGEMSELEKLAAVVVSRGTGVIAPCADRSIHR